MRPSVDVDEGNEYECLVCGQRVEDPDGTLCDCGGELVNLSRSRDL